MTYWYKCNNESCRRPILTNNEKGQCFECKNGRPPIPFTNLVGGPTFTAFSTWIKEDFYSRQILPVNNGDILYVLE